MTTKSELNDALEKYCDELGINACILIRERGAVDTVITDESLELLQVFVEDSGIRLIVLERPESEFDENEFSTSYVSDHTIEVLGIFFPELEIKRKQ